MKNPAEFPQPLPWHLAESGLPEIYDAAGDLVTAFGNDFNALAQDYANAKLAIAAVNALWEVWKAMGKPDE